MSISLRKNLFAALLNSLCLYPAAMATELLSEPEQIHIQSSRQTRHIIQEDMHVLKNGYNHEDKISQLSVIDNSGHSVFNCDVPVKDIEEIVVDKYGILYIQGQKQQEKKQKKHKVIVCLKKDNIPQTLPFELTDTSEIKWFHDGTFYLIDYVMGKDGIDRPTIIHMREDSVLQTFSLGLMYMSAIKWYDDVNFYAIGKNQQGQTTIIHMHKGIQLKIWTLRKLQHVYDIQWAPDGTCYIIGIDTNNTIIRMKENEEPQRLTSSLTKVSAIEWSHDGTLYIIGLNHQQQTTLIYIRKGEVSQPLTLGQTYLSNIQRFPDGTFCIIGQDLQKQITATYVKGGQVSQSLKLGLSFAISMETSSDGMFYVSGKDQKSNKVVVRVKDGGVERLTATNVYKIKSCSPPLISISMFK